MSRVTVRRALGTLDEEGLIFATRGSGRYVSDVTLTEPPNMLLSFTELGARKGLTATARVLALHTRPATLEEADVFGAAPGAAVFELDRLRMLDDVPVAIDHVRVPLAVAPDLPTIDFRTASLYAALESAGAGVAQTEYSTEAVVADADQARELGVSPGDPLLLARSTGYDGLHRVVELGEMTSTQVDIDFERRSRARCPLTHGEIHRQRRLHPALRSAGLRPVRPRGVRESHWRGSSSHILEADRREAQARWSRSSTIVGPTSRAPRLFSSISIRIAWHL